MPRENSMDMQPQVRDWDSIPVERLDDGIQRQMFVGKNLMVCRLRFPPFLVAPAHEHPHEQMTMVMQGRVRFIIGEEEHIAKAGDVMHFPPNCWHGATMLDEEVVLIDVFTPVRQDFLAAPDKKGKDEG